jgi:hypothetical protein
LRDSLASRLSYIDSRGSDRHCHPEAFMGAYCAKVPSRLERVRELEDLPQAIVAFGRDYPTGHLIERHGHLLTLGSAFSSSGVLMRFATWPARIPVTDAVELPRADVNQFRGVCRHA